MDFKRAFGKKKHKSGFRRVLKQLKSIDFLDVSEKLFCSVTSNVQETYQFPQCEYTE